MHSARTAYLDHDASDSIIHIVLSFYTQFTKCYSLEIHNTLSQTRKTKGILPWGKIQPVKQL